MSQSTAWAYLRKSRDKSEQADPELLSKHRQELLRYAAEDGQRILPDDIYEEVGSGETIRARPVFHRLLTLWERLPRDHGGIIYTTEVSRLTRGRLIERGRIQEALIRADIRHRVRGRVFNLRNADDRSYWEHEAEFASHELGRYRERVDEAWQVMLKNGQIRNGKVPFGYVWSRDARQPLPDPDRFPVLVAICRDAFMLSTFELSRKYHLPQSTIHRTLTCPTICGWPARRRFRFETDDAILWRYVDRSDWIWPEQAGTYTAAISREEFLQLQAVLQRRKFERPDKGEGWCRDVVRFVGHEQCAAYLSAKNSGRGWRVATYEAKTPAGKLYVYRDVIHRAAAAEVIAICSDPDQLAAGIARYRERRQADETDPAAEIAQQLQRLRRRYQEAVDAEMDEENPLRRAALAERSKRLEKDLERLDTEWQIASSRAPLSANPALDHLLTIPNLGSVVARSWETLDSHIRRRVVSGFLSRILVAVTPVDTPGLPFRREVVAVERQDPFRVDPERE